MKNVVAVQAENQHVFCSLFDMSSKRAEELGLGVFSRGGLLTPGDISGGRREKTVILEVQTCGVGNITRGAINPVQVKRGDLVIANLFHRSHDLMLQGTSISTFSWEYIMGRIDVNEENKSVTLSPLQGYVVCKTNEKRAQKITMGDSTIIAPFGDVQMTTPELNEQGRKISRTKVAIEEVVMQGPGAVLDGMWQEPTCRPGDMVIYDTSISPITFTFGGQTVTLVHHRHIIGTCRDIAVEE